MQWVAPRALAISSLWASKSTATIGYAPASCANCTRLRPTPPTPKITTDSPILSLASLFTTPAAVVTAQPNNGATFRSKSAGIGVIRFSDTPAGRCNGGTHPALGGGLGQR